MVWEASCILQHYEWRTGHILTREELDLGFLEDELIEADYQLDNMVSFPIYLLFWLLVGPNFQEYVLLHLPEVFPPNRLE